jgi:hypothetical protein
MPFVGLRPGGAIAPSGANDRMKPDWVRAETLKQSPKDPRRYTAREIRKVEAILKRFGQRVPLVADADGCVYGHFIVVIAARSLGIDQLAVVFADDLSPAERQALSLALNRMYELGDFDQAMLADLVLDLEVQIPDFRVEDIGFDAGEIDQAIAAGSAGDVDEKPLSLPKVVATQRGDIWDLGQHSIGCGDATDVDFYRALLGGAKAQMVFADPPFGCRVKGFVTTRNHREFVQCSGEMPPNELQSFFGSWCEALKAHCAPGAIIDLCIDWRSCSVLMNAASVQFGEPVNMAVWVKDHAGMGSFLRSQHELILIYAMPGARHRNNVELGKRGRNRTNVWRYPSAVTFARIGAEGDLLEDHPTPKPKDLVADAILDCTARGEIVLDPFLGSGSTLIAAEKTGRVCRGMDLDPAYVDLSVRRWPMSGATPPNSTNGSPSSTARWAFRKGPPVWICGDCHLGNLGPLADDDDWIDIQIRDLDQTVVGNPAYDLIRLALSLQSAARGSDLPGVASAHIVEAMVDGYSRALDGEESNGKHGAPDVVRAVRKRAHSRKWRHLADERIDGPDPKIPLGKRFWPLEESESAELQRLFGQEDIRKLIVSLSCRDPDEEIRLVDAAYWVKAAVRWRTCGTRPSRRSARASAGTSRSST